MAGEEEEEFCAEYSNSVCSTGAQVGLLVNIFAFVSLIRARDSSNSITTTSIKIK